MTSAAGQYMGERRHTISRGVHAAASVLRRRDVLFALGAVGLLGSFAGLIAVGDTGRLAASAFVPWIVLVAVGLGPDRGPLAGAGGVVLYVAAVEIVGGQHSTVALTVRTAALFAVGVATSLLARRLSSDALALQETSALQTALIDSTLDGICLTDPEGNVLLSNAPLRRISVEFGLPPFGTVIERLLTIAESTTEPARYRERMQVLATSVGPSEDEFEFADSGRVFRGYTAPVRRRDGTLVGRVWTLREVTSDRHLERLRDAFVAAVSHELRTPLTSISGFVEMLEDEEESLGDSARSYLDVIRRGTTRLQRIVEDLLLVAQIEADRLELRRAPADLTEIAAAAVDAARPAAQEKEISLELEADGALPLDVDAGRLGQVLDNLVSNALKFTLPGGSVVVSVRQREGRAKVEVADTGIGVPQEEVGQLFSRFYRASSATRRAIPGTGLGLVIARAIVEGHGGSVALESHEGVGTRVTVSLPVDV
ncbi:MAG: sensor histidine kinase [Gaiellaceae bacterium]